MKIIGYITWYCVDSHYSEITSTGVLQNLSHMIGPNLTWASSTNPTIIPAYSVSWAYFDSHIPGIITACHNKNVKTLTQFGFPMTVDDLAAMSSSNRAIMASNVATIVNKYNFDGVELDIEVPNNPNQSVLGEFIRAVRAQLPNKIVSTCGMAGKYWPDIAIADLAYVDWIDVMCYDFSFASPKFETAKYADTVAVMQKWLGVAGSPLYSPNFGFPASKLILGTPFYGYNTTNGSSPNASVNYRTVVDAINPPANMDEAVVNGLTTWWSGINTTVAKVNWALSNGLAGVMGFALGYDKLNDSRSLLLAINSYGTPSFTHGTTHTASVTLTTKPAGVNCQVEVWLGPNSNTKIATSGKISFVSTGASQAINAQVTMPVAGIYYSYIDVYGGSQILAEFIGDQQVTVT